MRTLVAQVKMRTLVAQVKMRTLVSKVKMSISPARYSIVSLVVRVLSAAGRSAASRSSSSSCSR
eukprot:12063138-Heterocapsa_arctica.AAC.1